MRRQDKYKLPRKKKKAMKLADPDLYRMRYATYKIKSAVIAVTRFGDALRVSINSPGGSVEEGTDLLAELADVDCAVEFKIEGSHISMAMAVTMVDGTPYGIPPWASLLEKSTKNEQHHVE